MDGLRCWFDRPGAAVVCELLAYYIPWLDNLLDAIASPAAVIGGMV